MNTQPNNNLEAEIARLKQEVNVLKRKANTIGLTYKTEVEEGEAQTLLQGDIPFLKHVDEYSFTKSPTEPNHLLLEGDNISSLTLLQETHVGKVDVIYIDPPYNTGNKDFVYNDTYVGSDDSFSHSKWLSFMKPRLELAKTLLKDTGVIFVSIDDNEQAYLKVLMDEIFGERNFVANMVWENSWKSMSSQVSNNHEYILTYCKDRNNLIEKWAIKKSEAAVAELYHLVENVPNIREAELMLAKKIRELVQQSRSHAWLKNYSHVKIDDNGKRVIYYASDLSVPGKPNRKKLSNGVILEPLTDRAWQTEERLNSLLDQDKLIWKGSRPYKLNILDQDKTTAISSIISGQFYTRNGKEDIKHILENGKMFSFPKPVELIKYLLSACRIKKNAIVLDFFAGSGTTGQAVAELNKEDGGTRQAILCTNNFEQDGSANGIARDVTAERMKRVLSGKNWADGKEHAPLPGNLHYYQVVFKNKPKSDDDLVENVTAGDYAGLVSLFEGTYNIQSATALTDTGKAVTQAVTAGEVVVLSSPDKLVLVYGAYDKALWFDEDYENTVNDIKTLAEYDGKQFVLYLISDERGKIMLDEEQEAYTFPLSYADGVKATVNKLEHQQLLIPATPEEGTGEK